MNKSIIQDEVKWLLEAINEQVEILQSYNEKIPQIELDMLMENVRKLYENLHFLNRLNDPYTNFKSTAPAPEGYQSPATISENVTEIKGSPLKFTIEVEKKVTSKGNEKAETDPAVMIHYGASFKTSAPAETAAEEELFPSNEFTFNEKLKEAREKTFGPKIKPQKTEGLRNSIGINDKFLFINELFDGNLKDYNEGIETLNGFHDIKSAFDFLDLLRQRNRWSADGKGFLKLKELIEEQFE